ncbi:TraB/GumN family protein [Paracoccus sp. SM22M-07]|uniref:TraB/GumN family protein n=1 Tax=Paracoccus sp. SM22M-07 TaxID=1520813 RepID=UPI0009207E5D|nr:TraB/GumN family protein [Paracoccus sp. SM22M-07]OJH43394.1 polysaccharide biosynthesis protein GumN [Paracoccus sp. SM22M-07]
MRHVLKAAALALLSLSAPAVADACKGRNLFDTMPADRKARIENAVRDVPFREGLLFQAEKGDHRITLVGTYHFGDARHAPMVDRLRPFITDAAALYVEAGPREESRLTEALKSDPSLMVDPDGPTLPERLTPEEWQQLSTAMADRGSPAVITSRLRPWYVSMMLGISPCMLDAMQSTGGKTGGLDHLLVHQAQKAETPIRALEPWDTIFDLYADLTPAQELDMIRAALPSAAYADDYAVTLTDAYFSGNVWQIWEFGRFDAYDNSGLPKSEVDEQMSLAQQRLMDDRNRKWIKVLIDGADKARANGRGIVAAFGALHLPGQAGVLNLLQDQGYAIRRLDG